MRRGLSLLLALLLLLPGCAKKEDETTSQDAETILRVMLTSTNEKVEWDALSWYLEPEDMDGYLTDFYKLEDAACQDGAIVHIEGARAFELAVLFVDQGDVDTTVEALQQYLLDRKGAFTGYFPDQVELLDSALILTKGQCVTLIVCQDPDWAKSAFESCFGEGINANGIPAMLDPGLEDLRSDGRLIYKDPGTDDMTVFDNSAILSAWESGNDSRLSKEDKAVLDAAKMVFDQYITSDMSDYDKELLLFSWLITHVDYDQSHYTKLGAPRTAYQPYGPLINREGVCLGYAETFRLFMDMAGIECITVTGAAFRNQDNHAWNMVRLNGEWYCVDTTWNHISYNGDFLEFMALEPVQFYHYFNVTSDYMADTDHQWDYDNVPEATAEDFGRP